MPIPATALLVEFPIHAAGGTNERRQRPGVRSVDRDDDPAEAAEAAFERGRQEGFAAAQEGMSAKLDEACAAFEARLAEQRAAWAADEGARLAEKIQSAFAALEDAIGAAVAGILGPFVEESLRTRVVEELAQALSPLLAGGQQTNFHVRGPEDLLNALREKLGTAAASLTFENSQDIDVRVVADRTVIETQLEPWLSRISGRSA
jgi:flagellar biosynthesis/type III secretory pathway protein FliH